MLNVNFEAMEKKIRIILERARDGVEPLEDLEQELLNLHSVSNLSKPSKFEWWTKNNLGLHWDFDEWKNRHVWSESEKEYVHMDDC